MTLKLYFCDAYDCPVPENQGKIDYFICDFYEENWSKIIKTIRADVIDEVLKCISMLCEMDNEQEHEMKKQVLEKLKEQSNDRN